MNNKRNTHKYKWIIKGRHKYKWIIRERHKWINTNE